MALSLNWPQRLTLNNEWIAGLGQGGFELIIERGVSLLHYTSFHTLASQNPAY